MSTIALPFPARLTPVAKVWRRGFGLLEIILVFAIVIGAAAVVFTVFPAPSIGRIPSMTGNSCERWVRTSARCFTRLGTAPRARP